MSTLSKFFKIILSYRWGLLLQFVIFVGGVVALSFFANDASEEFIAVEAVSIAIFDRDQTELTQHFVDFVDSLHDLTVIEDTTEAWIDAITWGGVGLIIEIPTGFTESFVNGNQAVSIQYLMNNRSLGGFLVNDQVERYFRILSMYFAGGFEEAQAFDLVASAFDSGVEVELVTRERQLFGEVYFYFRFLPIPLVITVAVAIGGVFLAIGKVDVMRRLESAPISYASRTLARVATCLLFSFLAWGLFIAVAFILFGSLMLDTANLLRVVNSLPLVFLGIALAFVAAQFLEKREMLFTLVSSVVMLFATVGIIIDLSITGAPVLAIFRFTPFYWYSRVNDMLLFETSIDLLLIWQAFVIQIAFAAAVLAVGMVFSKERRLQAS